MKYAYVDSSVWITRLEGKSAYQSIVLDSLLKLEIDGWHFCYSELVLLEVLMKPNRFNQEFLIASYNQAFSVSILLPTFQTMLRNALAISRYNHLKSLDSIHAAFAHYYECDLLITTDADFNNLKSLPLHFIDLSQSAIS